MLVQSREAWRRTEYAACCYSGARRKYQALEGNIDEILPSSAKVEQDRDKGGGGEGRG